MSYRCFGCDCGSDDPRKCTAMGRRLAAMDAADRASVRFGLSLLAFASAAFAVQVVGFKAGWW